MARPSSTRTYKKYAIILRRDLRRSMSRLVRVKRVRGQFIITLTRPSLRTSTRYLTALHAKKRAASRRTRRVQYGAPLLSILLLAFGLGGTIYGLVQLSSMQPSVPVARAEAVSQSQQPAVPSLKRSVPSRITIPDIAVDAAIIQLGKHDDGSMETPSGYEEVGWYKYSPTPGELGPSVIVGHVDNYMGGAVFFRLKELQPGQEIIIQREDTSTVRFRVTKIEQFDQDHFPTDAVYGNTADSELRVITCGGPFNHFTGEYTQNTVVYATYDPSA